MVRAIRESRGMRREVLAAAAAISFEYVRLLEGPNPSVPSLAVARRIAAALGVTVDEVFPAEPAVVEPAGDEDVVTGNAA